MRKTLTFAAVVLAAGSLAACKPFWQKEPAPAPTATVVEPASTAIAQSPATPATPSTPVEQTASAGAGETLPVAKTPAPTTAAAK